MREMSQIVIKGNRITADNHELSKAVVKASSRNNLSGIQRHLDNKIKARRNIGSRMNEVCYSAAVLEAHLKTMESFVSDALARYIQADDLLNKNASSLIDNLRRSFMAMFGLNTWNGLLGYAGKAGQLGSLFSYVLKPVANWLDYGILGYSTKVGARAVIDFLKGTNSQLKGLWKWQKSEAGLKKLSRMLPDVAHQVRMKRLVGLDDMFRGKYSRAGEWGTRFYNNFHKLDNYITRYESGGIKRALSDFTGGGARAVFAWGGTILSVAQNAFDNADEAKSGQISARRAVVETIGETAVDVAKYTLISAGVAAAISATAVAGAPVIVVGAATVGVSMALDWGSKKLTGKKLTEAISDGVIDGSIWVTNSLRAAYNKAANCYTNPTVTTSARWKYKLSY